ncbi:TatD family hydrolase [Neisseria sp. 23W00296]|uniref:TatD family hydrolase n=1 Tax=unclassified Neisseria TaxID=2623750 RepID=UPI0002A44DA3|nr:MULTISPECIES: TatD family hydrolase [unclassified Neisseria]ASP17390.1 TatD family deoxyribonuclease [Neisseria sp. KEM232]EKY06868.1 hydrolase, TatD family [Neisseria sp. oral taxon 020 str. F0370]
MQLIDSHCHLNFDGLANRLPEVLANMAENQVALALAVSVSRQSFEEVHAIAQEHANIYASVGIHPDDPAAEEFTFEELVERAALPKVAAIGETGLDYHWCKGDLQWQHRRFITHIEAANQSRLPLIIHTRDAADDTMRLLREHQAHAGVIHCFTEDVRVARLALDLGFYISFSGIVTFKNAAAIQEAARYVPLDRMLVETDSPFLAPVPKRGKPNEPAYVRHTAGFVAELRGDTLENIARATTENFFRLFAKIPREAV